MSVYRTLGPAACMLLLVGCFSHIDDSSQKSTSAPYFDEAGLFVAENFGYPWNLPEGFDVGYFAGHLQRFVNRKFGAAFKYIGVEEDFFHGHVLFTENPDGEGVRPIAILYHTQEHAHAARWKGTVDSKYDYLDPTTRNWIQFVTPADPLMDGRVIVNAREFMLPRDTQHQFFGDQEPVKSQHYTIHGFQIDQAKIGLDILGEIQVTFYNSDCSEEGVYNPEIFKRIIEVDGTQTCLEFNTATLLFEYAAFRK